LTEDAEQSSGSNVSVEADVLETPSVKRSRGEDVSASRVSLLMSRQQMAHNGYPLPFTGQLQ